MIPYTKKSIPGQSPKLFQYDGHKAHLQWFRVIILLILAKRHLGESLSAQQRNKAGDIKLHENLLKRTRATVN